MAVDGASCGDGREGARWAEGAIRGRAQPETKIASFRQVLVQQFKGTA